MQLGLNKQLQPHEISRSRVRGPTAQLSSATLGKLFTNTWLCYGVVIQLGFDCDSTDVGLKSLRSV